MNKNHRVLWSRVRNCFVVTHENARTHGKPSSTRKAVAVAVASLFLAPGLAAASPSCTGTSPVSSALTTTQTFCDVGVSVTSSGSVQVANTAGSAVGIDVFGGPYTKAFSNAGKVTASGTLNDVVTDTVQVNEISSYTTAYGVIVDSLDVGASLTNSKDATVSGTVVANTSVKVSDPTNTSYDYAYAYAATIHSYAVGIEVGGKGGNAGAITNAGTISGTNTSSAQGTGISQTDASSNGKYAYAYAYSLYNDVAGLLVSSGIVDTTLANSGTITATANNTSTANASNSVTNAAGGYVFAYAGDKNYNYAYGVQVQGDVYSDTGNELVSNSGTISGKATATGAGSATINIDALSSYSYAYAYAYSNSYAAAYGLVIRGGVAAGTGTAAIENHGTISGVASASDTSSATVTANGSAYANAYAKGRSYAQAYGVGISYGLAYGATFHNFSDGAITADAASSVTVSSTGTQANAKSFATSGAGAAGIALYSGYYDGSHYISMDGTLTNDGTVSAAAHSTVTANASATTAYNTAYSSLSSGAADANAAGIYLSAYMASGAALNNTGTVSSTAGANSTSSSTTHATAAGTHAYANGYAGSNAYATGVEIGGMLDGAALTNAAGAKITSQATSNASMTGTSVTDDAASPAATNISGSSYSYAYGIVNWSGMGANATLTNAGQISAVANTTNSVTGSASVGIPAAAAASLDSRTYSKAYATAYGLFTYGQYQNSYIVMDTDSSLTNSGSIVAVANAGSTSTSTAVGDSAYAYAYAYGVAKAYGIYLDGGPVNGATLTNTSTGIISATANATATATASNDVLAVTYARAYGVGINGDATATIDNAGQIIATANANAPVVTAADNATANAYAFAYGIRVQGTFNGSLTNSGKITAHAKGDSGFAAGLYVNGDMNATIVNSGTISGTGSTDGIDTFSIYVNNAGNGSIDNQAGALLQGTLVAGGSINVSNAGTINTGMGGSYVGGDYTQAATGTFKLKADSVSSYGSLLVNGTATLSDGTKIAVAGTPTHTLDATSVLTNVISAGTLVKQGAISVSDNILAINFTASDNGSNGIDLTAVATGLTSVSGAIGGSGGSIGGALDTLLGQVGNGTLSPELENALFELGNQTTGSGVSSVVDQLKPLVSGQLADATFGAMGNTNHVVQERQDAGRGQASGDYFLGNNQVWAKPFGSWANQDDDNGVRGFKASTYGAAVGVEGDSSSTSRTGVAFSYSRTDVDGNGGGSQNAKINNYQLVGYGSRTVGEGKFLDYQADVGLHDTEGKRRVLGLTAKSDYGSWSAHIGGGYGQIYALENDTSFTSTFRADFSYLRSDSYNETGAGGLNLSVGEVGTNQMVVSWDGKYTKPLNATTTLVLNGGAGYDILADQNSTTSAFAGAPAASFTTVGIKPSSWTLHGGAGVVMTQSAGTQVTARLDVDSRTGFLNTTASVKARWAF